MNETKERPITLAEIERLEGLQTEKALYDYMPTLVALARAVYEGREALDSTYLEAIADSEEYDAMGIPEAADSYARRAAALRAIRALIETREEG